jgi:hypothetical protein
MYFCPMHPDVRQADAGTCPKCGMHLLSHGMHFALIRYMASNPPHLAVAAAAMLALVAAAMIVIR